MHSESLSYHDDSDIYVNNILLTLREDFIYKKQANCCILLATLSLILIACHYFIIVIKKDRNSFGKVAKSKYDWKRRVKLWIWTTNGPNRSIFPSLRVKVQKDKSWWSHDYCYDELCNPNMTWSYLILPWMNITRFLPQLSVASSVGVGKGIEISTPIELINMVSHENICLQKCQVVLVSFQLSKSRRSAKRLHRL